MTGDGEGWKSNSSGGNGRGLLSLLPDTNYQDQMNEKRRGRRDIGQRESRDRKRDGTEEAR